MRTKIRFGIPAILILLASSGCAKNVDRIQFTKWGNSFLPTGGQSALSIDTTAQGGAAQDGGVIPSNGINAIPKASVGGGYHRRFSQSPNYRMVGGFHVNPNR